MIFSWFETYWRLISSSNTVALLQWFKQPPRWWISHHPYVDDSCFKAFKDEFCVNHHRLMIRSFFTGKKHHSLTFPYTNQLLKTRDFHLTLRLKLIESILCIIRHHKTKTIIVRKPEEFPPIKSHAIIIYHPVPPKMTNHWKQNRKLLS